MLTWPILAVILYAIHAYASYQNKDAQGFAPFLKVWLVSMCISPLWALVSRYSNNLLFDGLLYDILVFIVYAIMFVWLEQHYLSFRPINYIGIGVILVGMMMLKN
jgi:hypothetical protein